MASKLLGAHVKRKEDPRLITGASQYVADIAMPGLPHVAVVRSPHARIRGIKTAAAAKGPGVVLTDDGPRSATVPAGSVFVVPRGLWHRQSAPPGTALLFVTGETDISWAEDPRVAKT